MGAEPPLVILVKDGEGFRYRVPNGIRKFVERPRAVLHALRICGDTRAPLVRLSDFDDAGADEGDRSVD